NYIYVNTDDKYVSVNVTAYRFIRLLNLNSIKNNPAEMQVNGKNKKVNPKFLRVNLYKIFDQLCIFKIIQLSDFGMKNPNNAYAALAQNGVTTAVYKFLQMNGNYTKLRNYTVLNAEHSYVRYYAKAVTIINLTVLTKMFLIYLMEKAYNELKT
ncbi:MAG: hypothetical protein K2K60_07000, partial [Clostridia bacterium]|nr:hypothetical protein [Clostridia bacterium]